MVQIQYKNCLTLHNLKDTHPIKNPMYGPKNCGHEGAPFWSVWLLLVGLVLVGGDNPRFLHKLSWLNLQIREGKKKEKGDKKRERFWGNFFINTFYSKSWYLLSLHWWGRNSKGSFWSTYQLQFKPFTWYKFWAISFNKPSGVKNNVSKF